MEESSSAAVAAPLPTDHAPPSGIWYSEEHDNFYSVARDEGMGNGFWRYWRFRRAEFPATKEAAIAKATQPVTSRGEANLNPTLSKAGA